MSDEIKKPIELTSDELALISIALHQYGKTVKDFRDRHSAYLRHWEQKNNELRHIEAILLKVDNLWAEIVKQTHANHKETA